MKYFELLRLFLESTPVEVVDYPQIDKGNGVLVRGTFPWTGYKLGGYYQDGDVYNYIISQHKEFEDDFRVDGIYQFRKLLLDNIDESEWEVSDERIERLSKSNTTYPPIVLNKDGDIVDGNHRIAAAKKRGDSYILGFLQQ